MTTFTINDITCTIFIPSHTLYMTSHLICMMSHSLCVLHHTMTLSMESNTICVCYGIRHSFMTTKPLCAFPATMPDVTFNVFWHYTKCTNFLKRCEWLSSQPLYVWHQKHYIWHHIHSLWLHTFEVITLHPLHSWHHTPNIRHNTYFNTNVISAICPTISNTTSTVSVSSNPGYQLYHTHSLYDITHYMCDIIFSMPAITTTV